MPDEAGEVHVVTDFLPAARTGVDWALRHHDVHGSAREVGIRMDLGARPADVLRFVLLQAMTLAVIGNGCRSPWCSAAAAILRRAAVRGSTRRPVGVRRRCARARDDGCGGGLPTGSTRDPDQPFVGDIMTEVRKSLRHPIVATVVSTSLIVVMMLVLVTATRAAVCLLDASLMPSLALGWA